MPFSSSSAVPPSIAPVRSTDTMGLRQQESALILLNLAVLAGIAVAHVLFGPVLGTPSRAFFYLLLGRFLMQTLELIWLQTAASATPASRLRIYSRIAIWIHLLFAFALATTSSIENGHYVVLMLIPVIASAFRDGPVEISTVTLTAGALTVLQVWIYEHRAPSGHTEEYFEAASVVLIYVVVATVVALLARRLRQETAALERNLDELERTRDRLVEEEKLSAIGHLASAIAHEIRNPVAMIVSSVEMSRSGEEAPLDRDELFGIISQEARRLERLTADFLSYARRKPPQKEPTDLRSLIGYVTDLSQARMRESDIQLAIERIPDVEVEVDPFQIHQVLLNLLLNAVEATPSGGTVRVEAAIQHGSLVLAVENSGDGIPPDLRSRIFEPFFTTRPSGSGLGLAIARKICEEHQGTLDLDSTRPGWTRFVIRLPGPVSTGRNLEEVAHGASSHR